MKLFNTTNKCIDFNISDRSGSLFKVYLKEKRSTEIEPYQLTDDVRSLLSSGILSSEEYVKPVYTVNPTENTYTTSTTTSECACGTEYTDSEDNVDVTVGDFSNDAGTSDSYVTGTAPEVKEDAPESSETSTEDISESSSITVAAEPTVEVTPDSFVCPICKKEFATQRGLSMHTSREHK